MILKLTGFLIAIFLFAFQSVAQDYPEVTVVSKDHNSEAQVQEDMKHCYTHAEEQWNHTRHKTLKNTGAGAGVGAVIGKIFGKPGAGAVVGGAAGAYRGHKESKADQKEFNDLYSNCLREKGYEVTAKEE